MNKEIVCRLSNNVTMSTLHDLVYISFIEILTAPADARSGCNG